MGPHIFDRRRRVLRENMIESGLWLPDSFQLGIKTVLDVVAPPGYTGLNSTSEQAWGSSLKCDLDNSILEGKDNRARNPAPNPSHFENLDSIEFVTRFLEVLEADPTKLTARK